MRITNSGRELREEKTSQTISLHTKIPGKWVFIDTETNDIWIRDQATTHFRRAEKIHLSEAALAILSTMQKMIHYEMK